MTDPITQVQELIAEKIRAQTEIVSALGSDIKRKVLSWTESEAGQHDTNSQADLPEIQVRAAAGSEINLTHSSCSVNLKKSFEILVNSGTKNGTTINLIEFGVLRACTKMLYDDSLRALTWLGDRYVLSATLPTSDAGLAEAIENRGVDGWINTLSLVVEMNFTRDKMIGDS